MKKKKSVITLVTSITK